MRLSEISRPVNRISADELLRNKGYTRLGNGAYGAVYQKPGVSYVLKVFSATDSAYVDFLEICRKYPNPHFPKIIGKLVKITPAYWAVRLEPLTPLSYSQGDFVSHKIKTYLMYAGHQSDSSEYYDMLDYMEEHPELQKACDILLKNKKHPFDLKWDNLMKRGSTIVITDPFKEATPKLGPDDILSHVEPPVRNKPVVRSPKQQKELDDIFAELDGLFDD